MPDPGGWQDQAATFTDAWPIVMQEIAHWRNEAQKRSIANARKK